LLLLNPNPLPACPVASTVVKMKTLEEIERALPGLRTDELLRLDDLPGVTLRKRKSVFTGNDAASWWRSRAPMSPKDAEAFAADVESGRRETNLPPSPARWEL
jgi:hypothetical protein